MRVDLKLDSEYTEPLAVIYTAEITDEVTEAIAYKNEGRQETISQFCARKWNSDFSREMTRSVRAWLSGFPFEG